LEDPIYGNAVETNAAGGITFDGFLSLVSHFIGYNCRPYAGMPSGETVPSYQGIMLPVKLVLCPF
jgi:hypothetical protein